MITLLISDVVCPEPTLKSPQSPSGGSSYASDRNADAWSGFGRHDRGTLVAIGPFVTFTTLNTTLDPIPSTHMRGCCYFLVANLANIRGFLLGSMALVTHLARPAADLWGEGAARHGMRWDLLSEFQACMVAQIS